ncbi:hypothetical protein DPMN_017324 [Dreissena polymorpha]|uniref:Uncharacterized protein n=1 Tax=Dreissena polymorpha TaxID=45954 RepID=A0A9D4NCZ2_DREPO|nr:hypothetical protein DPMN_017324 [Dreissena polymorpha]
MALKPQPTTSKKSCCYLPKKALGEKGRERRTRQLTSKIMVLCNTRGELRHEKYTSIDSRIEY